LDILWFEISVGSNGNAKAATNDLRAKKQAIRSHFKGVCPGLIPRAWYSDEAWAPRLFRMLLLDGRVKYGINTEGVLLTVEWPTFIIGYLL